MGFAPEVYTVGVDDTDDVVAREVADGSRLVIVGGGDGTLSRAVKPLLNSSTALGVLPLGTGNTFARNLGLPMVPEAAARILARGRRRAVDVGLVNGRPFLNSVSVGISSRVAAALTRDLKRRYGWGAYAVVGWRALRQREPFTVTATLDGSELNFYTQQLVVSNALDIAADLRVPHADFHDGDLVLLALPGATRTATILRVLRWRLGDASAVRAVRFTQGTVILPEGDRVANVDGELLEQSPLHVQAAERALQVIVP